MAEYIEREKLFKFLTGQTTRKQNGAFAKGFNKGIMVARAAVHNKEITPTADVVEVVHSKWIKRNNERRCPICDFFYMTNGTTVYNLCPMCGAKMDATDIDVGTKNNLSDDVRQNLFNTFMKGSED